MRRNKLLVTIAGAAVAAVVVGGIAFAAIPDAGFVIHTCYSQSTGTWRPIDYPTVKCKPGETQLDFNQKGLKGATGAQGIQGTPGKDGANGIDGTGGVDGQD